MKGHVHRLDDFFDPCNSEGTISVRVIIFFFLGGEAVLVTPLKASFPLRTTFAFTHPCFKMCLERSLNPIQARGSLGTPQRFLFITFRAFKIIL